MVSITAHDQQFEVVSVPANDENLLASANAVSANNENDGETVVDPSALVHVAASVMVEELLHSEDQENPDTSADTSSQQAMFITEACKSDDVNETDSYAGQLVSGETVSCLTESEINASENLLPESTEAAGEGGAMPEDESEVQVSDTQYDDQPDTTKTDVLLDDAPVDDNQAETAESSAESVNNPEDGQVVTSSDAEVIEQDTTE